MVPQIIKRKQNHKATISHGSPCDSTINHKATISHGSPCESTINHKATISHGSPCESTINHKATISHVAHDISPCTMTTQLTPLNNYLSNCIITSSYTPSYTPTFTPLRYITSSKRGMHASFQWTGGDALRLHPCIELSCDLVGILQIRKVHTTCPFLIPNVQTLNQVRFFVLDKVLSLGPSRFEVSSQGSQAEGTCKKFQRS